MSRSFIDILRECQRGAALLDLDDRLSELTSAVLQNRGAGKITLVIAMKPDGDNSVEVDTKVTLAKPNAKRGKSIFFVNKEMDLVRNDPRQPDLPLRAVETVAAPAPKPVAVAQLVQPAPKEVANG